MKIAFIGLGTMGMRMATCLLKAGYTVTAYNRTQRKRDAFVTAGGTASESVSEVAGQADVIFSCLSTPQVVEEIYLGREGVLAAARQGVVCVDHTTVDIETSRTIYSAAGVKSIHYLDAPVSGGPEGAETGTLSIMVGGDRPAFDRIRHLLAVMGKNVQYLGKSGLGTAAKLMNQYLVAVHTMAAAEVMVSAQKIGLEQQQLYNLLLTSYGYSRMLERHMEHFVLPGNFKPGGAMKYLLKDLRFATALMLEHGVEPATGVKAQNALESALEAGWGDKDMAAVFCWLENYCEGGANHD